jgi:hypothetical protein
MNRGSFLSLALPEGASFLRNDVNRSSTSDNKQCPGIPLKYYGLERISEMLLGSSLREIELIFTWHQ